MTLPLIDVHTHVTPPGFPTSPSQSAASRWPCMQCHSAAEATLLIGDKPFRKLDDRSWSVERRLEDMDRDGVQLQALSPMPELLSYWLDASDAEAVCLHTNHYIAEMIALRPMRFRGLGAVPLQDPLRAATALSRLKNDFGLSGVEIGSNINGVMLGDRRFDPFYEAAEALSLAIFVHALHPVAAKAMSGPPSFTAFALFPIDVAMAAASLLTSGTLDRFPNLRIGFSHGGGALGSILGRLDKGWETTAQYDGAATRRPSDAARSMYFDSNVYDPVYLGFVAEQIAPGHVFAGTDYPYTIMQPDLADYLAAVTSDTLHQDALRHGAAASFLDLASSDKY